MQETYYVVNYQAVSNINTNIHFCRVWDAFDIYQPSKFVNVCDFFFLSK